MRKGIVDLFYPRQIEFIRNIQEFASGADGFFRVITSLGSEPAFLILLPLIYWSVHRRTGINVTFLFLISAQLNALLKIAAHQPRPFQFDSSLTPLDPAAGFGLPSGHTQNSVVTWGYLAGRLKTKPVWIAACCAMVLVPFSRIVLGVHFPTDVLGGYLVGGALLWVQVRYEDRISKQAAQWSFARRMGTALGLGVFCILMGALGDASSLSAGATLAGAGVGLVLERRMVGFDASGPLKVRALRYLVGMALLALIYLGLKKAFAHLEPAPVFRAVRYGCVGLFAVFGGPYLFKRLGL